MCDQSNRKRNNYSNDLANMTKYKSHIIKNISQGTLTEGKGLGTVDLLIKVIFCEKSKRLQYQKQLI